ncbi:MAG: type VI secretion system tip protein VgrG [Betaproteobacteria bacterium]|nr:type VI secretion system tip protein VgrG [Betaproteobacteria bacterium]
MNEGGASGRYRAAQIATKLGADALVLTRVTGREELGRLFEYSVEVVSERADIAPESILATNATLVFETEDAGAPRYINGDVTRFSQLGEVRTPAYKTGIGYGYRLLLQPRLWFSTRRADCRIFNDMSVPDIIKQVLNIYGGSVLDKLSSPHSVWKYCVQYRESDFDFVSRLMEQEGIYYYFVHADGKHELTLSDSQSAHMLHPDCSELRFFSEDPGDVSYDVVDQWSAVTSVQPGKYRYKDYDFFKARTEEAGVANTRSHTYGDLEVYDYTAQGLDIGGDKSITGRTAAYVNVRMEELQSRYRILNGAGNVRGLRVGYRFKLKGHYDPAVNAEYLATAAELDLKVNDYTAGLSGGGGAEFRVTFSALKADQAFHSQRLTRKPLIHGAQTAMVVGKGEIDTDEFGRVQLQFHWDRVGGKCWARVTQSIAGNKWGAFFIPRVGQEVVVEFLEGDPDLPIVTGVVYNGLAKPPYALPGEKTKSTIKTNSSEGGGGFNELRFEDKKGSEQIFIHGEKQLDVRIKKDRLSWIGQDSHLIVKQDRNELVEKDQSLKVKGDLNEEVTGIASLKVNQSLQYKVAQKSALDSGQEIHFKAGMNIILEAGTQISLKVGGNFINITPAGVDILGTLVKINSGGSAGSGSGASPAAPKAAKEADTGEPGKKDEAPPKPAPPPVQTYSPQAVALKQAAQSGAPFCEI